MKREVGIDMDSASVAGNQRDTIDLSKEAK